MVRPLQLAFSDGNDAMFAQQVRHRKAETMLAVLADHFGQDVASLRVLTVGCSAGYIERRLAESVDSVVGVDIDAPAIRFASQMHKMSNLGFAVGDAMNLSFSANVFDVVVCSQVYEHVPDASSMMAEIYRVLAPGGVCYFAATNRFCVMEQHYFLPFLSIVPVPLAHLYLRIAGKGRYYYERHLGYFGLSRLCNKFTRVDYTRSLVLQPDRYGTAYLFSGKPFKHGVAKFMLRCAYWLFPGYVWLLQKPRS